MLGRLEMGVDECIETYTDMFGRIFGKKGLPVDWRGRVKGRFDSIVLEECIQDILRRRGLSIDELLEHPQNARCKVVVCAKTAETSSTVLIRSYRSRNVLNHIPATICEAARATSAASSFFEPVKIGPRGRKFVDGGLGANNPVEQIWNEAQNEWCTGKSQELATFVKCVLSIGTGNPGIKPIAEGALKFFSETLVNIATQTEATAKIFAERHRLLYESKRMFRFNVEQGLQGVGLEEYKKDALIETATSDYMDLPETKPAAQQCATNLKTKEYAKKIFVQDIEEWNNAIRTKAHQHRNPITIVPFLRNDNFVSRQDVSMRLLELLPYNASGNGAIWGLGGCGKTQIALEYAYRRQEQISCSIFWVHGDNEARFNQSYSNLAMEVGLSPELNGENLLWAVKHWLEQQSSWLVVIDNADELSIYKAAYSDRLNHDKKLGKWDLFQYIPQPQRNSCGAILWTSRDGAILSRIVGPNRGLELGTMTMQESWMLFQKMLGTLNDKTPPRADEEQLMVLLGGLPLAIAQAAAYIRNTKISSSRYISLFRQSEDKQSKLLEYEFDDPYRLDVPNSVMQTWSISVQQASQEYGVARLILNTIAFLDHQGLPFEILQAAAGPDASEDEVLLVASRLTEYSLLQAQQSIDDELPTYEQHRLMQVATRNSLSEVDISWTSGKALEIADHLFPSGEFETWTACKRYLPHALKASSWKRAVNHKEHAIRLLGRMGMYYLYQGRSDEAEKLEVEVLELSKNVLREKHPDTILAMANLAATWWQQGRSDKAEKLQVEVLELRKKVLGEKHPDTVTAMANLAVTWQQQGRSDEAEKLKVKVLELQKNVLGERHPETIRAMASLAATWWQQGRSDKAEKLLVEVLNLRKNVLGEKHPDTIKAMANLSSTWWQQGRSDKAEKLQVEVLELSKNVLGEKHPDTITAMAKLASTWWQQGHLDEAEKLQVEVLEQRKDVQGEKHPDTIKAMASLAATWWQQGRSDKAEKLEVEVLELRKNVLGERHPETIRAMANLAATWWQQGRSDEAEKLKVEVLELRKKVLGEKHPDTIKAMANLAST